MSRGSLFSSLLIAALCAGAGVICLLIDREPVDSSWHLLSAGLVALALLQGLFIAVHGRKSEMAQLVANRTIELTNANVRLAVEGLNKQIAEEDARANASRVRAILDATVDSIITFDKKAMIQTANAATSRIFGHAPEELIGQPISKLVTPVRGGRVEHDVNGFVASGMADILGVRQEWPGVRKDGAHVSLSVAISSVDGTDGRLFTAVMRDETEARRAQNQLETQAARLARQNEALRELSRFQGIVDGDMEGSLRAITEAAANVVGVERASVWLLDESGANLVCRDLYETGLMTHSSGLQINLAAAKNYFVALQRDDIIDAENARTDPRTECFRDGYLDAVGIGAMLDAPIRHGGQVVGVVCHEHMGGSRMWRTEDAGFARSLASMVSLALEAARRRESTAALQQSNQRFRDIAESVTVPMLISRVSDGKVLFANQRVADILRRPLNEVLGACTPEFYAQPAQRNEVISRLARSGALRDYELQIRVQGGGTNWVILSANMMDFEGERCIVATFYDVTARVTAEAALKDNAALLHQTGHMARVGGWRRELNSNMITWSEETWHLYELDPATAPPLTREFVGGLVLPEYRAAVVEAMDNIARTGKPQEVEFQIITGKGSRRWLRAVGDVELRDGEPVALVGAVQDITERREIEERLRNALASAEEATRLKGEFVANMSHEIRTPMNGIIGMTSIVLGTQLTQQQRECIETIHASGDALLNIVNDVLDYSKIEAGRMDMEAAPFDPRQVIEESLDLVADKAHQKGVHLTLMCEPRTPRRLVGDAGRLRQIILNLTTNAVKFTSEGNVHVAAMPDPVRPGYIRIEVRDTGIGMSAEVQARIFAPFMQADSSTTRRFGGSGLGLAISNRLVEFMGGSIGVESAPGHGSTFWFTLPMEAAPVIATEPVASRRVLSGRSVLLVQANELARGVHGRMLRDAGLSVTAVGSADAAGCAMLNPPELVLVDALDSLPGALQLAGALSAVGPRIAVICSRRDRPAVEAAGFAAVIQPVRLGALLECLLDLLAPMKGNRRESRVFTRALPTLNARVLVAEDNPVNQKVVRVMLERLGCKPEIVPTGAAAVEAAALGGWDCILMDCQMPEMDGYEATKRIRSTEAGARRIPIMALTASAMQGDKERCMEAGMDEYLTKPLKLDALAGALDRALRLNPTAPAQPEPEPIEDEIGPDLSRLREMVGDDEPLIDDLLGSFLVAGAERLAALDVAVGNRDAQAIAQAAHSIKGAAANFGAGQVTEVAAILERQGRNQQVEPAAETRPFLHTAFMRLRARILATRPNIKLPVAERPIVELN